ncbi:MAG: hypothetical protein JWP29_3248, partial [Rhodoferax sp.]|nr:hypothetical protein [Rhodoferax sp.]
MQQTSDAVFVNPTAATAAAEVGTNPIWT